MEKGKAHVVVLPYHGQGHINPMIQFSKRLAANGIQVTIATSLINTKASQSSSSAIVFQSIYDDCTHGGVAGPGGLIGFLDRFEDSGSRNLTHFIRNSEIPVKCLVYDANITWASRVASHAGIARAGFFTQSCAAIASYYPMYCELSETTRSVPTFSMLELPEIGLPNVPSLGPNTGRYPPIIRYLLQQFNNSENAKWVLFNSFDKLEEEVIIWMSKLYTVNIKQLSLGSNANLSTQQTIEVAKALKQSNKNFLWVVKPSEESKLPTKFSDENSDKGLVVSWCPQLAVLAHKAVGCFLSHCGWNSTVEAITLGVPMVAMPQFLDQMTNAHFVACVRRIGMMPKADEEGVTRTDEIKRCIDEIMQGEEIRKNVTSLKELAKEAIDEGGSSVKYIDEIVSYIAEA